MGSNVSELLEKGDSAFNTNNLKEALDLYNKALNLNPENTVINRKLAKVYHKLKEYKTAENNYKIYLQSNEKETEAWIELGETQRQMGAYKNAKESFETALKLEPNNDLAKRSIMETDNNILSCISPDKAYKEKQAYAQNNLNTAIAMVSKHLTPAFMKDISDVQIKFGQTASMMGTSNIAQYENRIKTITVSNAYIYAAPEVIAAYLVHEGVHAKDKDAYTSIREEQDAYKKAAEFWIKNSKGIQDPEMDYAAELYKQSPSKLSNRVEEIYLLRDPEIAKTSPNHPPDKIFHFNKSKTKAANQPIKSYDTIA